MTERFEALQKIYGDYLDKTVELNRNKKLGEGIFGMAGPKTAPCHDLFVDGVRGTLEGLDREAAPGEAREILTYMFRMPVEQRENDLAYWMLLAVHSLTLNAAETLDSEDAGALLELYLRLYPKRQWLPAQKTLVDILKARQAGQGSWKR